MQLEIKFWCKLFKKLTAERKDFENRQFCVVVLDKKKMMFFVVNRYEKPVQRIFVPVQRVKGFVKLTKQEC